MRLTERQRASYVAWARRSFCGCAAVKLAIRNFLVMTMAITIGEQKACLSEVRSPELRGSYGGGRAVGTLYLADTGGSLLGAQECGVPARSKGEGRCRDGTLAVSSSGRAPLQRYGRATKHC